MKIVKSSHNKTEEVERIFHIFDKVLYDIHHKLLFDKLVFVIGEKNKAELKNFTAYIEIDRNNEHLMKNPRFCRSFILNMIYKIIIQQKGFSTKHRHLEQLVANREMIKHGYHDDVFYYNYMTVMNKPCFEDIHDFIYSNISWLSFYDTKYSNESEFFRKIVEQMPCPDHYKRKTERVFNRMKRDLWNDKSLERVEKCLERLANADNKV
ncbi:MAG: hypothetical protein J4473_00550 [Candidatus Aenigmarchaeota archaeon]|nr:hypothetical protein [Candidatus Aenigmarchaeota archaeon]